MLNDLSVRLSHRYNRTGNIDDLKVAILKAELAVIAHPNEARFLNDLGNRLLERYFWMENIDDLQAGISKTELAVSTTPEDEPNRAVILNSLGGMLIHRYNWTKNMDDLQAAQRSFMGSFNLSNALPQGRINSSSYIGTHERLGPS